MKIPLNIHPDILYAIRLLSKRRTENMDKAISIIKNTVSDYDTDRYPDYSTGLAGIGYGIQYMICTGLIDANGDEVLSEFDRYLFSTVCLQQHTDFSHATGLLGIASYFFARLEDPGANDENLSTVTNRTILLSILDILLAKFGVNGYSSFEKKVKPPSSLQERSDIEMFIRKFISHDICNELALKLLNKIKQNESLSVMVSDQPIEINMSDATIIIPIRADSNIRIQNLQTIIRLYTDLTNAHFIILEADQIQRVHLNDSEQVRYLFQKDENPIFYHTHYRNELIKLAETPIVIVWDTDILVPVVQLYKSVDDIRKCRAVLSYPYDGICYTLSPDLSNRFRQTLDWKELAKKNKCQMMFGQLTVGGLYVINREKYMQVGMENEYFVGWGPEDVERLKRLTLLDIPVSRVSGCIYHLYHPRELNSGYVNQSRSLTLKKELLRICRMDRSDLFREIATWKWLV